MQVGWMVTELKALIDLLSHEPERTEAGLRCCEGKRRPGIPTGGKKVIWKVGYVFDGLGLAERQNLLVALRLLHALFEFVQKGRAPPMHPPTRRIHKSGI